MFMVVFFYGACVTCVTLSLCSNTRLLYVLIKWIKYLYYISGVFDVSVINNYMVPFIH